MRCFPCEHITCDEENAIDVSAVLGNPPSIKVVILGGSGAGKSSLVRRIINDEYSEIHDPNVHGYYHKEVNIDGKCVELHIDDNIECTKSMKEGDVFLLVYSITSKTSFNEMETIRKRLLRYRESIDRDNDNDNTAIVVIGNKCDLEQQRQIHREEGSSFCKMINVPFFETSAKERINDKQCFYECFREWIVVKSDVLREKEMDRRRREKKLNKKYKEEHNDNIYIIKNTQKLDHKIQDETMDINMAIIGTHNVGKHSIIRSFIDKLGNYNNEKKDTYYTSIKTKERISNDDTLKYKEKLELILNVYCIEYRQNTTKNKYINKCILTPSSCRSGLTGISRKASIIELHDDDSNDMKYNAHYDELISDGFDFNEWHNKQLNITDIARNNDAFLFIMSMDDKQSFVQCIDIIKTIKNDTNHYDYNKPILMVVTKTDLPRNKHELTECDIAEFAVDIGCPFILISPETFKAPFHRVLSSIRGYCRPSSFVKINNLQQHDGAVCCMKQSLNGKYLYSGGNDGTIRIWDIETSLCIAMIVYHTDIIYQIEEHCITLKRQWWKPCRYLITCCGDNTCCVWMIFNNDQKFYGIVDAHNVVNNNNIPLFINCPRFVFKHQSRIRSFVICNNNILCTVGDDKRMKLWSLIDGQMLYNSGDKDMDILNKVVFVKECNKIFAAARNQCVYVWDISRALARKKGIKLTGGHHNSVNNLKVCTKNKKETYIISMDASGYIRCRDARSPQKIFWDYSRHTNTIESVSICHIDKANMDNTTTYDYMLCTASRDRTVRGYSIPDGEVIYNVRESDSAVTGIDCNQTYIVSASKDHYIRCYKVMSDDIKYTFDRPNISNNLQIALSWSYQRHQSDLNEILCGKKQFKHMVFSCDDNGIILGWNMMNNGECMACFGNDASQITMIKDPKRSAAIEYLTMFIQFLQLTTFTFCIDKIHWGYFNERYNPLSICSHLLQFDVGRHYRAYFDSYVSIPFEWMMSIGCVLIFVLLFCISYKLQYNLTRKKSHLFDNILRFFCWITFGIGFIPILRNILSVFECKHVFFYLEKGINDCYSSVTHYVFIIVSVLILIVFIAFAFRMEYRSHDLNQINLYYWMNWSKDYPQHSRVHFASKRQRRNGVFCGMDKSLIILMTAISILYDKLSSSFIVSLLIGSSATLCISMLIEPLFYSKWSNLLYYALLFGVFWTNLWSLFVINSSKMQQLTGWNVSEIDKFVTLLYLVMFVPFMCFGAVLMFMRTHRHFYDEIRGDFRKILHSKGIGFISQDLSQDIHDDDGGGGIGSGNVALNEGMRHNLFFLYNKSKQKQLKDVDDKEEEKEEAMPPPLVLSYASLRSRVDTNSKEDVALRKVSGESGQSASRSAHSTDTVKVKASFSLVPLCENDVDNCNETDDACTLLSNETSIPDDDDDDDHDGASAATVIDYNENEESVTTDDDDDDDDDRVRVIDVDSLHTHRNTDGDGDGDDDVNLIKRVNAKIDNYYDYVASSNHVHHPIMSHMHYHAPPIISVSALNSTRSDVTAFSGIGDVPDHIGVNLFD